MGVQAALFQQPPSANPYRRLSERDADWRAGYFAIVSPGYTPRPTSQRTGNFMKCRRCKKDFYVPVNRLDERAFCSRECWANRSRISPREQPKENP